MKDYARLANDYAKRVVSGRQVACEFVRLACQRQIDDLKRWSGKKGPYYFDEGAANRICGFIEILPHIKGSWARRGEKIKLEPWQCFGLTTTFGWKRREDGKRRFRTSYWEIGRKNAKTTISAGVGLYLFAFDGEAGAEVYSAATKLDQSKIAWEIAGRMVKKSAELRGHGLEVMAKSIVDGDGSSFRPLSADADTMDGLNISGAVIDELHAHKTREVWDVVETATGSREQPLTFVITTAGSNRAGVCYEVRDYVTKILRGTVTDETYFGWIFTLDDGDDWADEKVWPKPNPNLGVSVKVDDLRRKATKALSQASAQPAFQTKHTNIWVNSDQAWMDMRKWEACGDPDLDIADFRGEPCWLGLDLASKTDIAALAILFERDSKRYLFRRCWIPEETAEESSNAQLAGWVINEYLETTDGATTDFEVIADAVREVAREYDVRQIAVDPWQALKLMQELQAEGLPVVEYRNTTGNLSEPMKQLEAWVYDQTLAHEACPMAAWMVSNVVAHWDDRENVKPRKEHAENKIDWPVAAMYAVGMYLREQNEGEIDLSQMAFA